MKKKSAKNTPRVLFFFPYLVHVVVVIIVLHLLCIINIHDRLSVYLSRYIYIYYRILLHTFYIIRSIESIHRLFFLRRKIVEERALSYSTFIQILFSSFLT